MSYIPSSRAHAMRSLVRALVLGVIAVLCAACPSMPRPSVDAAITDDATYFVVGVEPNSARFDLSSGTVKDGIFNAGILWAPHWYAPSEDGYLVVRATRGETLAIVEIQMMSSNTSLIGPVYVPCARTLVLESPPGKVVYLTHMTIRAARGGVGPTFHRDLEAARAYMHAHYPALADHLEQGQPQMLPVRGGAGGCAA
jgi:hypothetical protein